MCVIIARQPGISLPADKMESACIVNSDGYGLSIVDRGKIETIKEFDPKGNDPEKVMKRLEDAKDHQVYLHLRFRTSGKTSEQACHPFDTFTKEQDGFHISFMHNGTLNDFDEAKSDLPDSYHFNMKIVRPLLERVRSFCTTDDQMLQDEFVKTILTKYAGSGSKFVLFDQNGNEMIVNKSSGMQAEGWWASNSYSFNRTHRSSTGNNYKSWAGWDNDDDGYGGYYGGYRGGASSGGRSTSTASTVDSYAAKDSKANSGNVGGGSASAASTSAVTNPIKQDAQMVAAVVANANLASKYSQPALIPPTRRDTFCELTGLNSLAEIAVLEKEDFEQLVENYPEVAVVLMMDLAYELYLINTNAKKVA